MSVKDKEAAKGASSRPALVLRLKGLVLDNNGSAFMTRWETSIIPISVLPYGNKDIDRLTDKPHGFGHYKKRPPQIPALRLYMEVTKSGNITLSCYIGYQGAINMARIIDNDDVTLYNFPTRYSDILK